MTAFVLDARLKRDCHNLAEFPLCRALLMDDARFVWCILVPRVPGARDAIDLNTSDYAKLWDESAALCRGLRTAFAPHKLNVAALGNQVEQLHVHHIARFRDDPLWPQPVWGTGSPEPCPETLVDKRRTALLDALPARLRGAAQSND